MHGQQELGNYHFIINRIKESTDIEVTCEFVNRALLPSLSRGK